MATASDSEDCLSFEAEVCGEAGCSAGKELLLEACDGAEAMMSSSRKGNDEGCYCIETCCSIAERVVSQEKCHQW